QFNMSSSFFSPPSLNSSLFRYITSIPQGDHLCYHFFQPLKDPLILISKDGTPLASIHTRFHHESSKRGITTYKREDNRFQTLLNEPNQSVGFFLTNLTDYRSPEQKHSKWSGMLDINLMPTREAAETIQQTNPENRFNEWNEVDPYDTAMIWGNKNSKPYKNSRFVIQEVFNSSKNTPTMTMTVEQDEKSGKPSDCFSMFVAVHPQKGFPELEKKFRQGTRWITANEIPWFFIRSRVEQPRVVSKGL